MKRSGITEIDMVGNALSNAFAARAESERHQRMLIGELNHRVKNTLSVVQSLAYQTFRGRGWPRDAIGAFVGRVLAVAGARMLLSDE